MSSVLSFMRSAIAGPISTGLSQVSLFIGLGSS